MNGESYKRVPQNSNFLGLESWNDTSGRNNDRQAPERVPEAEKVDFKKVFSEESFEGLGLNEPLVKHLKGSTSSATPPISPHFP